jgi:hypothetical protein
MGYAYGYLCSSQLVEIYKNIFSTLDSASGDNSYESKVALMKSSVTWPQDYLDEATGCLFGIVAAEGEVPVMSGKYSSRPIDLDMILTISCGLYLKGYLNAINVGCSSFAAWGGATGDGLTRVGGNADGYGPRTQTKSDTVLVVRKPDHGFATINVDNVANFLCGFPGPFRGMNETGMVLSTQGALGSLDTIAEPGNAVSLREVLENVSAGPDMVDQIVATLQNTKSVISGDLLFVQKSADWSNPLPDQMAVVIEKSTTGFSVRLPSQNTLYNTPLTEGIVGTNHFLSRIIPGYQPTQSSLDHYDKIVEILSSQNITSLADMQKVLQAASSYTAVSVYFEPDSLKFSVALALANDPDAPYLTPVTFTWEELFAPILNKIASH